MVGEKVGDKKVAIKPKRIDKQAGVVIVELEPDIKRVGQLLLATVGDSKEKALELLVPVCEKYIEGKLDKTQFKAEKDKVIKAAFPKKKMCERPACDASTARAACDASTASGAAPAAAVAATLRRSGACDFDDPFIALMADSP